MTDPVPGQEVCAVLQRVTEARVLVSGEVVGEIGAGVLVLLGILEGCTPERVAEVAQRAAHYRIFEDEAGHMNRSLIDCGLAALVVSQFTLAADGKKGRRPSFDRAAAPAQAEPLVEHFVATLEELSVPVATGRFGAQMRVELVNAGPATFLLQR